MAFLVKLINEATRRHQHLVPRPGYVVVNLHHFLIFDCKGKHISKTDKARRRFFLLKFQAQQKSSENITR